MRCSRCRLHSNIFRSNHTIVGATTSYPLSSFSPSPLFPLSISSEFPTSSSHRQSSSLFRNSLMQNQLSNEHRKRNNQDEIRGSSGNGKLESSSRVKQQQNNPPLVNNDKQQQQPDKQQHNQRPRHHSVRLIGESAARQTTRLFLEICNNSSSSSTDGKPNNVAAITNNDTAPWKNVATLVAAEQALEFWAHRNNNSNNNRQNNKQQHHHHQSNRGKQYQQSTLEEDADMALRLFTSLHHFHCKESGSAVLTNGMYSHVIDALAKSPNLHHVSKADALLRQFISLYIEHYAYSNEKKDVVALLQELELHDPLPTKNEDSIRLASKQQPLASSALRLKIPTNIEWNSKDNHHFPNQIRITGVMRGYARQSHPRGAESLLSLMVSLSSSLGGNKKRMFRPNEVGFATVIDAYSRVHDGLNAERVLQLMKERSIDTGAAVVNNEVLKEVAMTHLNGANVVAYNAAISAWARSAKQTSTTRDNATPATISSSRAAAENAESLLREMWSEHDDGCHKNPRSTILPDVVTYSSVISAYATCLDQPYGMNHARELLKELEGLAAQEFNEYHNTKNEEQNSTKFRRNGGGRHAQGFQPNTMTFNTVLQACANAGDASTAETILQSMISLHSSSLKEGGGGPFQHVRPNTRTFNVVLNAWAKKNGGDGGVRANKILDRLEKMDSNNNGPQPDVISYNTVLAAWSKSASVDPTSLSKREEGAQSSSIVGKCAAYEALKLLDKIEHGYLQSKNGKHGDHHSRAVKPDAISYSTTIAAFANAAQHCENGTSMAEEAEGILSRMKDQLGIAPDAYSYNGVLLAWGRSSGGLPAAKRAETILRSMREPTIISWSTVVNAYTNADGAPNAAALLGEMEQNVIDSSRRGKSSRAPIIPSIVLYNNVLHAWGRSSDGDASRNAELLLDRMERTSQLPRPDVMSYQLVLTALEHTTDPDKAERAKTVLDRFLASVEGNCVKPRKIQNAYNSVLTACAYTPANAGEHHRNNAARILMSTLRDLNQFPWPADDSRIDGPDQESYALFVQGCTHLFESNSEDRNMLLKSAFHECCQKGLLNRIIWDKFCGAMSPGLVKMFIEDLVVSLTGRRLGVLDCGSDKHHDLWQYENLPEEWSNSRPMQ